MTSRSTHLLQAAFALSLAACRKTSTPDPKPLEVDASAALPVSAVPTMSVALAPAELRLGQRCAGAVVAGLKPAKPVDSLELRFDLYPSGAHEVFTAGLTGQPCAKATDVGACKEKLAALVGLQSQYLVYTRGDEVAAVKDSEVADFLAPIETASEAAYTLVMTLASTTSAAAVLPSCDPALYEETPEGWRTVHTTSGFCEAKTVDTYVLGRDGKVKSRKTDATPPKPGCSPPRLGRRPEGLVLAAHDTTLGGHFAECTEIEAASVHAFERLAAELTLLDAPPSLRRRARRAAADEARHARAMQALARANGGRGRPVAAPRWQPRSVRAIAIENVVEGCVFETWAALLARYQEEHAASEDVRRTMRVIAADEARHAALAWDVAAWVGDRLSPGERAEVEAARAAAIAELGDQLAAEPNEEIRCGAGLPSAREARVLFATLFGHALAA